jgi:hypothetical protein
VDWLKPSSVRGQRYIASIGSWYGPVCWWRESRFVSELGGGAGAGVYLDFPFYLFMLFIFLICPCQHMQVVIGEERTTRLIPRFNLDRS